MLNKNAKLWVEALRSGKFKQTTGRLAAKGHKFCCLGVACEVAIANGVKVKKEKPESDDGDIMYDGSDDVLPVSVQKWLGLKNIAGTFAHQLEEFPNMFSLIDMNDTGHMKFKEIADVIESKPKGLFGSTKKKKKAA